MTGSSAGLMTGPTPSFAVTSAARVFSPATRLLNTSDSTFLASAGSWLTVPESWSSLALMSLKVVDGGLGGRRVGHPLQGLVDARHDAGELFADVDVADGQRRGLRLGQCRLGRLLGTRCGLFRRLFGGLSRFLGRLGRLFGSFGRLFGGLLRLLSGFLGSLGRLLGGLLRRP